MEFPIDSDTIGSEISLMQDQKVFGMSEIKRNQKKRNYKSFSAEAIKRKNQITKKNGKTKSFQKIAEDSDLNVMLVRRLVGGGQSPKLSEAYAIAEALGTTVDKLTNSPQQIELENTAKACEEIAQQRQKLEQKRSAIHREIQECEEKSRLLWEAFAENNV